LTIGSGHKQIGQLLLQAGVIDELQLRSALGHQRQWGGRLGRILMELKFIDENTLVSTLARQLGLESTRITGEGIDLKVIALVPQTIAERYWIFPLSLKDSKGGGELTVAVADPTNLASVEDVRFHTGKRIKVVVAPESDIEGAIKRFYYGDTSAALAASPAGEEVFASSPTSLADPEEDLVELEPIPAETQPGAAPPRVAGEDPLEDFFDGLTPPPVTGGEALIDLEAQPVTSPPPAQPPSVVLDSVALGAQPPSEEAPPPIRVESSAFDSPRAARVEAAVPPAAAEVAPFIGEDEISLEESTGSAEIPPPTEPEAPVVAEPALAAPYPRAAQAEAASVLFDAPPAEEASPAWPPLSEPAIPVEVEVDVASAAQAESPSAASQPFESPAEVEPPPTPAEPAPTPGPPTEPAFAVDLDADARPEAANEGAPFSALAPPLAGAAAVPAEPRLAFPPVEQESPAPALEASPMVMQAAFAALSEPEAATPSAPDEPPVSPEQGAAPGTLGIAPFTEGELQILDNLEARLVGGTEAAQVINPAQLVSALIRLLLRKGLLDEAELIEELQKR
jgi:type IV pilus assembly protein PilB